jgi:S-DNA-T family DNA segregation ATPase FtsK/SpoIIIE
MGLFKGLFKHHDNQSREDIGNPPVQSPILQPISKPTESEPEQLDQAVLAVIQEADTSKDKKPEKRKKAKSVVKQPYVFPPIDLLNSSSDSDSENADKEVQFNADKLSETLSLFGVKASIVDIIRGPSVTRYEIRPAPGVKVSKITGLEKEIALSLAAKGLRIIAPIPGKAAIGIDVPNKVTSIVTFKELIESDEFQSSESTLNCVLGKSISGEVICTNLSEMPHLLIAGTTGSGKSVCINSLLMSILFKANPDEVKLLLIDPKSVEFSKYNVIPHLLVPVVTDVKKATGALNWAVSEMHSRYRVFSEYVCRDIETYNQLIDKNLKYIEGQKLLPTYDPDADEQPCLEIDGLKVPTEHMCRIVIAIDELSELMLSSPKEVEVSIHRIAQMARAAGIHLVVATQHPTSDIITGTIKANIPSRIALKVGSHFNSQTILGVSGAEKLSGHGDMLYSPVGAFNPIRVQGCFVQDDEIERVTEYIKKSNQVEYNAEIEEKVRRIAGEDQISGRPSSTSTSEPPDTMMEEAIKIVVEAGQASTSLLQRRLKVGYARAGRMIDDMEQMGIVGPHKGDKPRDVLITYNEWIDNYSNR